MKVISNKTKKRASASSSEETIASTKATSKTTKSAGKEPTPEKMAAPIQGNGLIMQNMAWEFSFLLTNGNTQVHLKMIINTEKGKWNDLMELVMKGYEFMGSSMERESYLRMGRRGKAYGRKEFY